MADGSASPTALADFAARAYPTLDDKSYYQLLNVASEADTAAIRTAFYRIAKRLHPDRFAALADAQTREKLESIYARVCEAYRVLSSPEKRALYDRALARGKRRFDFTAAAEKPSVPSPEDALAHPEAKKFFRLGMVCLVNKDWKGAVMNFGFARSFEPTSPLLLAKIAEAQAGAAGPSGAGGGGR